jgi:hypothetical protein
MACSSRRSCPSDEHIAISKNTDSP